MSLFTTSKLKSVQEQASTAKKHTIVIVDDEPANLSVMRSVLESDYQVLEAESGNQALALIQQHAHNHQISMVISDQRMPYMNGVDLLIKAGELLPKSIKMIVSGYTDVEAFIDAINSAHIYQFILKPFEREDFIWKVKRAIEAYELQQELDIHLESLEQTIAERTQELADKNTELEQAYQKLEEISLTDPLTQLKNRRFLEKHIEGDVAQTLRNYQDWLSQSKQDTNTRLPQNTDILFFLIDLDHFKSVNDTHGHEAGDLVLQDIKMLLEQVFRSSDLLIRWGGEEFLVVARGTNRTEAAGLAERLRKAVEQHGFDIGSDQSSPQTLNKTCSIGYAAYPFNQNQPEQLDWQQVVNLADKALYIAKNNGRNGWVGVEVNCLKQDDFVALDSTAIKDNPLLSNASISLESNLELTKS